MPDDCQDAIKRTLLPRAGIKSIIYITGPGSLVVKVSTSRAGGRRFESQWEDDWGAS